MIETLMHMVGLCPDHFSHLNLLDMLRENIVVLFSGIGVMWTGAMGWWKRRK